MRWEEQCKTENEEGRSGLLAYFLQTRSSVHPLPPAVLCHLQVMQLATYLTYFAPQISPRMWTLFPRMVQVGWWAAGWGDEVVGNQMGLISMKEGRLCVCEQRSAVGPSTPCCANCTERSRLLHLSCLPAAPPIWANRV